MQSRAGRVWTLATTHMILFHQRYYIGVQHAVKLRELTIAHDDARCVVVITHFDSLAPILLNKRNQNSCQPPAVVCLIPVTRGNKDNPSRRVPASQVHQSRHGNGKKVVCWFPLRCYDVNVWAHFPTSIVKKHHLDKYSHATVIWVR